MVRRKNIRKRGKVPFSRAFQELKQGDSVAVVKEITMNPLFPKRIQGRTGKIEGKRGRSFIVNIKDIKKEKKFIINPVHLKKIVQGESK